MDQYDDDRSVGGKAPRRGRVVSTAESRRMGFFQLLRSPLNAAAQAVRGVLASPRDGPPSSIQHDAEPAADQVPPPSSNQELSIPPVPEASTAGQQAPVTKPIVQTVLTEGWSPDKMTSLAMFLQTNPNKVAAKPIVPVEEKQAERPYLGLRYLLENGVPGVPLPDNCLKRRQVSGVPNRVALEQPRFGQLPKIGSSRYQPYTLEAPKRARPAAALSNGFGVNGTGPGTPIASLPAAPISLVPPAAVQLPLALPPPPTAIANSARQGLTAAQTPGLSPLPASAAPAQPALTPYPKPTPGGATPSLGFKRGRDAPSVTPLVGSGIKNLAEYKRQRQRYTQPASRPLNALLGNGGGSLLGTPRGNGASSRSNSASLAATPYGSDAGQDGQDHLAGSAGKAPTETARRILETLDNMAKSSENTPQGTANKTPKTNTANTPLGLSRPGSTPFPKGPLGGVPPPPLDRISPNVTPAPPSGNRVSYGLIRGSGTGLTPPPALQGALALTPTHATPERSPSRDNLLTQLDSGNSPSAPTSNGLPVLPAFVPPTAIVAPAMDVLAAMKPAGPGRPKSADRKSVRFNVPEEAAGLTPAPAAAVPVTATTGAAPVLGLAAAMQQEQGQGGLGGTPVFVFGQARFREDEEVEAAVKRVCKSVDVNAWTGDVPRFTFKDPVAWEGGNSNNSNTAAQVTGLRGEVAPVQPAVQPPVSAWPVSDTHTETLQAQVQLASAVPLPDDDDDAPLQTPTHQPAPTPADANPVTAKPSATPAAPVSSGWGDLFLQSNQASMAAASAATAQEIEKAKTPQPAPAATGGFGFSFGATPSASPAVTFGATPAPAVEKPQQAEATQDQPPATATTPAAASPAPEPAVSSGWGDMFLKQNQAAFSAASDATAKEIEKAKTPEAPPATTFNFGASPFPAPAAAPAWGTTPAATPDVPRPSPSPAPEQPAASASSPLGMTMSPAPEAGTTNAAPASPAVPTFGVSTGTSGLNFGLSPTPEPQPTMQSFGAGPTGAMPSFGGFGSTAPAFGSSSASVPSFGTGTIPGTPGFASTTTQQQQQQSTSPGVFAFGATPAPQAGAAGTPSTPTFTFGAAPAPAWGATPAPASTPTTAFTFGASSTAAPAPAASVPAFSFGAGTTAPATTSAAQSNFVFGGSQPAASSAPAFGFGGQSSTLVFGATPAATPAAQAASVFGATPAASPAPNTFGQPGATPFVFGNAQGPPSVSPFGGPSNFMGSTPSPGPSFGGLATPPTLGGVTANAGSTPFVFGDGMAAGAAGTSAFGAPPQQPVFGSPLTPADQGAGASGLGMSLGDFKSGDRRKLRVKRHQ